MSYSVPGSETTGGTVTAAEWNVIVDDILACAVAVVTAKGDIVAATGANAIDNVAVSGTKGGALVEDSSASAGVKFQQPQAAALVRASSQSITNNTDTAITFSTGTGPGGGTPESIDTNSLHDLVTNSSRITASVAGVYMVGGEATFQTNATGQRYIQITVNGSTVAEQRTPVASASTTTTLNASILVALSAAQYVELEVYQNSGGALNCTNARLWAVLQYIT